jgi:hypothetical protein
MSAESDVAAVRAALLPAIARDAARRSRRRWIAPLAVLALLLAGSTAVAAATGVIWSEPKIDHSVPSVPEWQYYSKNPYGHGGGPVLMRAHPEALARLNRASEAALAADGVAARCGGDAGHPLACYLPSGELAPPTSLRVVDLGPADYDVKPLTDAEAHAWLCAHPTARPGAHGGEKPAPTKGYEDC